jgi:hypothetical protein
MFPNLRGSAPTWLWWTYLYIIDNQYLLNGFTGYGSQYGLRALVAYTKITKNSGRQKIKKVGSWFEPDQAHECFEK